MSRVQNQAIVPPTLTDSGLKDFSQIIQNNFEDLFETSHTHLIQTTVPTPAQGQVNDIIPVLLGTVTYLYVKFPNPIGWKKFGPGA